MAHTIVKLDPVFDDDTFVIDMVHDNAPYWTTIRYVLSNEALAARPKPKGTPWFRGDWAYGGLATVARAERFLTHEPFHAAAREVFGWPDAVVRPAIVYLNLNTEGRAPDPGHRDVPLYRGIDRNVHGVQVCHLMRDSGLFERWRIPIATSVAWFSNQTGGEFVYWPAGPDAAPVKYGPPFRNTALVSDNDTMFHCVAPVGINSAPQGITADSLLAPHASRWVITEEGATIADYDFADVRISVSWKGYVFADATAARIHDEHSDDLTIDRVASILGTEIGRDLTGASLTRSDVLDDLLRRFPRRLPATQPT